MKNYLTLVRRSTFSALLCGIGYAGYQISATLDILNNTLDTTALEFFDHKIKQLANNSQYISLPINKPEKSTSLIDRFWDSITFSYARRLLNLAQSDDREIRLRAVRALAEIQSLDDWHYSLLAHMCDARTAVGLARTSHADLRFFIYPSNRLIIDNHVEIAKWMQNFMVSLNQMCNHPCLSYFIKKEFVNVQEVGHLVEHDITSTDVAQTCIQWKKELVPQCVESLLHHSTIGNYAKDIVMMDGLPLLMETYKRYKENKEVVISLVKIISNISVYPELLQEVFKSGWVGVLANLLQSNDIRISGPVAKTLANFDLDDHLDGKFERKVYLLYPTLRTVEHAEVDIVLVHGLLGGVFFTWRQRDREHHTYGIFGKKYPNCYDNDSLSRPKRLDKVIKSSDPSTQEYIKEVEERKKSEWDEIGKDYEFVFHDLPLNINGAGPYSASGEKVGKLEENVKYTQCWPKDWLPKDCKNLRIIGIDYDSNLSMWAPMCPTEKLENNTLVMRSEYFLEKLAKVGVGKRPIVWITHSMGGLLVKNMLTQAWESKDENIKKICNNTEGIVFYSTPHRGSHVASLNHTTSLFLWPSVEVQELKEGSPALLNLHEKFLELVKKVEMKIISFVETESTIISPLKFNIQFVGNDSAKLNVGEYFEIPLDHFHICKPVSRQSFLYQKVLGFIKNIMRCQYEKVSGTKIS